MIFDFNLGFNNKTLDPKIERPLIAISAHTIEESSALHIAYSEAIIAAGGIPLIVPHCADKATLKELVSKVDGLLLSGGADVEAAYFNEENLEGLTECNAVRDYYEFMLLRAALDRGLPIFGICRGLQLLNIALGGSIYQDLPSQFPTTPLNHSVLTNRHLGVHDVEIREESWLAKIMETTKISVNSRHHQGLKKIAPQLKVTAYAEDGVVEAAEAYPQRRIIGVQWHPENMATKGNCAAMQRLFRFFVDEAKLYSRAKKIHSSSPVVDSHCDTPMLYDEGGFDLSVRNELAKVDIAKMEEGRLDATITVAYIPQRTPKDEATDKAFEILNRFVADVLKNSERAVVVQSVDELLEAKSQGLRSVILGVENGLAVGDDLLNLDKFKELGVVYITLCHNGSNDICDSGTGEPLHSGVSEFGREVIQRMNELGITVDISHSSQESTLQAVELSNQPIIASHSSCKALCDHPRNLSDEAIQQIAKSGGVVQICCYSDFLSSVGEATIVDLVSHIEYVVELVGYDYVGVGSDFDGGGGIEGFEAANDFICLTVELLRRGHRQENIAKIMGGNLLRVLSNNLAGSLVNSPQNIE